MKIKMRNLKKNTGFTTADIVVAIIVMMIFVGLITTLFYNFYLTTTARNRNAMATNYKQGKASAHGEPLGEEEIKAMNYDDISGDTENNNSINELIQQLEVNKKIPKEYTITGKVQKYNEIEGNTDKKDFVKILTVAVEYNVGKKAEKIEISTLITKKRSEV